MSSTLVIVLCLLTAVCWAASPLLLKFGMRSADFYEINVIRAMGFSGFCGAWLLATDPGALVWRQAPILLGAVATNVLLGNVLGDLLYFRALSDIGVSRAVAITSTYPLVAAGVSAFWLGEPLTVPLLLGTVSIVGGLVLLRMEGDSAEARELSHPVRGFLGALTAGIFWGMGIPITKWLVAFQGVDSSTVNLWRSLVLLTFSGALWLLPQRGNPLGQRFRHLGTIPVNGWISILLSGGVGLGVAGFMFISVLRFAPASVVTLLTSTSPLLTTLFAVFVLGERLRRIQWIGTVLVVAGSAAVGM